MAQNASNTAHVPSRKMSYDLLVLGVLMVLAGLIDISVILKNPDYRMPVFGMKLPGKGGWYFILIVFPLFHFIAGYGAILRRKWAFYLFVIPSVYIMVSAAVSLILLPPPHRIRSIILLTMPVFIGYLFWRRKHFRT